MKTEGRTVSKGKLKAKMLEYFREVEASGKPLIVTDRGREVLEVRPIGGKKMPPTQEVLARYRAGGGVYRQNCTDEELMSSGEDWEALSGENGLP